MTRQPPTDHPPPDQAAIVFLDSAPGDREAQIARLARWAERQARRLATSPAPVVELSPAPVRPTRRAS